MNNHFIYQEIYNKLSREGCNHVDRKDLAFRITDTLRAIKIQNTELIVHIEKIIVSIIYHHYVITGNIKSQKDISKYIQKKHYSNELRFETEKFDMSLCQIMWEFINTLRNQ